MIVSEAQNADRASLNLHHENRPEVDLCHVEPVTSLWSIAKSENETSH
jgi:hypothetical protein